MIVHQIKINCNLLIITVNYNICTTRISQLAIARPDVYYTSTLQTGHNKNTQETSCDQS